MARLSSETINAAFTEHLQPGETILQSGYGVKQPGMGVIIGLFCLAVLPGAIAIQMLTKHYLVALTGDRLIVLQVKGMNTKVKGVREFSLDGLPEVKASTGAIFTHLNIKDPEKAFKAKFHRAAFKGSRENMQAIAEVLTARGLQA